ncbi:MAG: hypothetical protein JF603_09500 [Acidobacteria bacterium]|nr:hypothetical protein [Acidobacteriota bacterium]
MSLRQKFTLGIAGLGLGLVLTAVPATAQETTSATEPTTTTIPTTTTAPNRTASDEGCGAKAWPATVQGQPTTLKAGSRTYAFYWHDRSGWHIRVTHPSSRKFVFTGHVQANTTLAFREVLDEKRDVVRMDDDHMGFTFRFTNYGHLDGVNFRTDCATRAAVGLDNGGDKVSVRKIVLGKANTHPTSNPVVITRSS